MREQELARLWSTGLPGKWLTQEGEEVEVVSPGLPNDDRGPDFVNAVIMGEEGRLVKGDVEVHLLASQFRAHGHHHDHHYNSVILHLVLQDDVGAPTLLANGIRVPILTLGDGERLLTGRSFLRREEPCRTAVQNLGVDGVVRTLKGAGEARFRRKGRLFSRALARSSPEEVLYQGIMEALGYSRNQEAFLKLAQQLPWESLRWFGLKAWKRNRVIALQAVLMGCAGLLPAQCQGPALRDAPEIRPSSGTIALSAATKEVPLEKMDALWASFGIDKALDEKDWHFFRVRPGNSPRRRLMGAAILLARYLEGGLVHGLVSPLEEVSGSHAVAALEEGLAVYVRAGSAGKELPLVGKARAREIAVNVVLPFVWAWGGCCGRKELSRKALEVYRGYPRLAENRITRYMTEKLGLFQTKARVLAAHQQGLHHIYQRFCQEGDCNPCPFFCPVVEA